MGRQVLTRLRSGTSELRIHTGRFDGLRRAERICRLCADDVETERHFLLDCSFYSAERQQLWSSIDAIVSDSQRRSGDRTASASTFSVSSLSADEQLILMTGGGHAVIAEAKCDRPVMSALLIAVAKWMQQRKQRIDELDAVVASLDDEQSASDAAPVPL